MTKFKKHNPGGPGRPRGSRNKINQRLDAIAGEGAEAVLRKMVEVATGGDRVAARLVLNRIWSAPQGRAAAVELPVIRTPDDLLRAHRVLSEGISDGTLTAQDAAALSSVLETHRRAFELVGQQERVEMLEAELLAMRAAAQA